jgi:hypothetical protein
MSISYILFLPAIFGGLIMVIGLFICFSEQIASYRKKITRR